MTEKAGYCLHDGLGFRLTLAARINSQRFEAKIADLKISRQMWCVLVAVGEQHITQPSAIADYIGINRTAASRSLRQMLDRGLLQRLAGTRDRRTSEIAMTPAGQATLDAALPLALANQAELKSQLSAAEQAQFSTLLDTLLQGEKPPVAGL